MLDRSMVIGSVLITIITFTTTGGTVLMTVFRAPQNALDGACCAVCWMLVPWALYMAFDSWRITWRARS